VPTERGPAGPLPRRAAPTAHPSRRRGPRRAGFPRKDRSPRPTTARRHRQTAAAPRPHPSAAAPAPGDTLTRLPVDRIDPNPWNPRSFPAHLDAEDRSLADSLRHHGVLEPLLVRPLDGDRYQLVFGERRLRAAAAAGLPDVPVLVRALDDPAARILTVTENLHQRRLPFLAEAAGIDLLFDDGWTADQIARELGKPRSWVARRRRLHHLSPDWRRLAEDPEAWTARWGAPHFEHIALLEPGDQDDLLARSLYALQGCDTPADLARLVGERTHLLIHLPFDLADPDLDPVAGPCTACPLRSSHHPGLFDDQEALLDDPEPRRGRRKRPTAAAPDRCLSPACAARKTDLHVARRVADLAATHANVLRLHEGWSARPVPGTIPAHDVQPAQQGAAGAVPAVVTNGPEAGTVRWVKPLALPRPTRPETPDGHSPGRLSLAARRERHDRRRQVHAIHLLRDALQQAPPPELAVGIGLAITFGTDRSHRYAYPLFPVCIELHNQADDRDGSDADTPTETPGDAPPDDRDLDDPDATGNSADPDDPDDPAPPALAPQPRPQPRDPNTLWAAFDDLADQDDTVRAAGLWEQVLPVLLSRMNPDTHPTQVPTAWQEARRIAALVHLDPQDFFDQAAAALPDPKSWAQEEAALARKGRAIAEPPQPSAADPLEPTAPRHQHPATSTFAAQPAAS
jgi:ParB/RepB/Spo0J family partition protein